MNNILVKIKYYDFYLFFVIKYRSSKNRNSILKDVFNQKFKKLT